MTMRCAADRHDLHAAAVHHPYIAYPLSETAWSLQCACLRCAGVQRQARHADVQDAAGDSQATKQRSSIRRH
ncbi:hypothetical protein A7D35_16870 [Xanthomonas arboricola]|nr:hypothetical protein A7D35_16870 [Xanthomonas arboricola]